MVLRVYMSFSFSVIILQLFLCVVGVNLHLLLTYSVGQHLKKVEIFLRFASSITVVSTHLRELGHGELADNLRAHSNLIGCFCLNEN